MPTSYRFVRNGWDDAKAASPRSGRAASSTARTSSAATSGSPTPAAATPPPSSPRRTRSTDKPVEVLWVKGSGGDLRTSTRENFSSLYQDKLLGLQEGLRCPRPTRASSRAAEDDMVGDVRPRDLQPQPAGPVDRHAAALVPAGHACRPHAPERDHRDRRLGRLRAADPGNLRGPDGLRALDAARLRARPGDAGDRGGEPGRAGDHDGPARLHLLGRRRQGMLHA